MRRTLRSLCIGAAVVLTTGIGCSAGGADQPVAPAAVPPIQPYTVTAWPLRLETSSGLIDVYQPQPEKLEGDTLTSRAAVSLTPPGASEPVFGAIWMTARVFTDRDARTVTIVDVNVRRVAFPDSEAQQQEQFQQILQRQLPRLNITFALDELMTSLDTAERQKVAVQQLQTTPPKIIFTTTRSTLITIDGRPKLQPAPDQPSVMQVVNTPFIILFDMPSKRYFLKTGDTWMSAPEVTGPWGAAADVPRAVAAAGSKLAQPAENPNSTPAPPPPGGPGQIIVTEEPDELIWTDGPPKYTPLPGNDLLYVSNTPSDVFMEVATQNIYVLLSGRWYRARSFQGPWEYVPADHLPAAFARVPADSEKAHVLASVAGTVEAQEARIDAAIPQTAAIRRDSGADLNVAYDGEPDFQPVPETSFSYCVNTPEAVVLVDRRYYCCHQAVWYEAIGPRGPWLVCTSVPQVIYTIPPSCPIYPVRYVYVYDYTPDVVYCGYLPGYTGCYVYGPTVVYGTGYIYPAWYRTVYICRPPTWGLGVRFELVYNSWGDGAPYGWDHRWFARTPERREWFGPRGFVDYHRIAREPRPQVTNVTNVTNIRNVTNVHTTLNIYNHEENVRRNVNITRNVTNTRVTDIRPPRQPSGRSAPEPAAQQRTPTGRNVPAPTEARTPPRTSNNVYVGADGQLYRRTDSGWEQRTRQGWSRMNSPSVNTPAPSTPRQPTASRGPSPAGEQRPAQPPSRERTPEPPVRRAPEPPSRQSGLESDYQARQRGAERSRGGEGGSPQRVPGPSGSSGPSGQGGPSNDRGRR